MVQVSISVVPMWQTGEEPRYLMTIVQDITERRQAEKALQASEADLREAQSVARMGSWRLELPSEKVTASDQLFRLIGLEPKPAGMPFKELGQFFLPESWRHIVESNRKAFETGRTEEIEVACPRADGSVAWLLVWDIKGKVYGVPIYKLLGGPTRDRIRVYGRISQETGVNAMKTGPNGGGRGAIKYVEGPKFVPVRSGPSSATRSPSVPTSRCWAIPSAPRALSRQRRRHSRSATT